MYVREHLSSCAAAGAGSGTRFSLKFSLIRSWIRCMARFNFKFSSNRVIKRIIIIMITDCRLCLLVAAARQPAVSLVVLYFTQMSIENFTSTDFTQYAAARTVAAAGPAGHSIIHLTRDIALRGATHLATRTRDIAIQSSSTTK